MMVSEWAERLWERSHVDDPTVESRTQRVSGIADAKQALKQTSIQTSRISRLINQLDERRGPDVVAPIYASALHAPNRWERKRKGGWPR